MRAGGDWAGLLSGKLPGPGVPLTVSNASAVPASWKATAKILCERSVLLPAWLDKLGVQSHLEEPCLDRGPASTAVLHIATLERQQTIPQCKTRWSTLRTAPHIQPCSGRLHPGAEHPTAHFVRRLYISSAQHGCSQGPVKQSREWQMCPQIQQHDSTPPCALLCSVQPSKIAAICSQS